MSHRRSKTAFLLTMLISMVMLSSMLLTSILSKYYVVDESDGVKEDPRIIVMTSDPNVDKPVLFKVEDMPDRANLTWSIPEEGRIIWGEKLRHNFSRSGEYEIRVKIRYHGIIEERSITIFVRPLEPPHPRVLIQPGPEGIYTGDLVILNGSTSFDQYGNITIYKWSVHNTTRYGEVIKQRFSDAGTHIVGLSVVNDDGIMNTTWVEISVHSADELLRDFLTLEVNCSKPWHYIDEGLEVNVELRNTGDRDLITNDLDQGNIYFHFRSDFLDNRWKSYSVELGSRRNGSIGNGTWPSSMKKIWIGPNSSSILKFDIRESMIFTGKLGEGEEWRTLDWFIDTYMTWYWIDTYLEVTMFYLPTSDMNFTIQSKPFKIPVEWRQIHQYVLDRRAYDQKELDLIKSIEKLDYENISGKGQWSPSWWYDSVPSYINTETIRNYTERYNAQRNYTEFKTHIFFNYTATVHELNGYAIDPETGRIMFQSDDGSSLPEGYHGSHIKDPEWEYRATEVLNHTDFEMSTVYALVMYFSYKLIYAPLGGDYWGVYQVVVVTEDLEVLYILSEPSRGVS
ncbi:MAG: hypothetical protein ACMUHM_01885 [Thermoplasmatota archaeon]